MRTFVSRHLDQRSDLSASSAICIMDLTQSGFAVRAQDTCSLCRGQLRAAKLLPCLHSFCVSCLTSYVEAQRLQRQQQSAHLAELRTLASDANASRTSGRDVTSSARCDRSASLPGNQVLKRALEEAEGTNLGSASARMRENVCQNYATKNALHHTNARTSSAFRLFFATINPASIYFFFASAVQVITGAAVVAYLFM